MQERWTKAEAEYLLGTQRGCVQEWINLGFIQPCEEASQGVAAKLDRKNLHEIRFMSQALLFGIPRIELSKMLKSGLLENYKYLFRVELEIEPPLLSHGIWKPVNEVPSREDGKHKFYMVIDLSILMHEVDRLLD